MCSLRKVILILTVIILSFLILLLQVYSFFDVTILIQLKLAQHVPALKIMRIVKEEERLCRERIENREQCGDEMVVQMHGGQT